MIYTAYYYINSILNGELLIRDGRFCPGKYFETWPIWLQYVRKHYPDEHIVVFADAASPISIEEGIKFINEPYEFFTDKINKSVKIHIKALSEYVNQYFWAMQRNIVTSLIHAYENNEDYFWIDNDAFLNSDIHKIRDGADVFAPNINHEQFTCDSICTFISKTQLHKMDILYNLPDVLKNILKNAPFNTRMHCLHESGFYKMFCHGKIKSSQNINIAHFSCYENFIEFLEKNPLPTHEYSDFLTSLKSLDISSIKNTVNQYGSNMLNFEDMYYEEV